MTHLRKYWYMAGWSNELVEGGVLARTFRAGASVVDVADSN